MAVTVLNAKDTNDGWNGVSVVKGIERWKTKEDSCKLKKEWAHKYILTDTYVSLQWPEDW